VSSWRLTLSRLLKISQRPRWRTKFKTPDTISLDNLGGNVHDRRRARSLLSNCQTEKTGKK